MATTNRAPGRSKASGAVRQIYVLGTNRTHWRSTDAGVTFQSWTGPGRIALTRGLAWHGTKPERIIYHAFHCDNMYDSKCSRRFDVRLALAAAPPRAR